MDTGTFTIGELQAKELRLAAAGEFYLTAQGPVLGVVPQAPVPTRVQSILIPLAGEGAFHYPVSQPLPRVGAQIVGRSVEVALGPLGAVDTPSPGDLGIGPGGLFIAFKVRNVGMPYSAFVSLVDGAACNELDVVDLAWARQWQLWLVSSDGLRRHLLVDRSSAS